MNEGHASPAVWNVTCEELVKIDDRESYRRSETHGVDRSGIFNRIGSNASREIQERRPFCEVLLPVHMVVRFDLAGLDLKTLDLKAHPEHLG